MTDSLYRTLMTPGIVRENRRAIGDWLLVGVGLLLVSLLHYATLPGLRDLHAVYRYFYFLPIVYAALRFGFWGGVLASVVASLIFAPHILFKWGHFPEDGLNDLLVVVVFYGVAVITGITVDRLRRSRRQQEETARRLAASLQQLEVQGEELRRAEHLSALGRLAGGLAHEIRNPVGIIHATAQLLAMECGPEATEGIAIIQQETDRIERTIQDLLNYAGEGDAQQAPTQVIELLRQVVDRLRPVLDTHSIQYRIQVPDDLPSVHADAAQMEQALMNLCVNAVQAMNRAGQLCLSAEQGDPDTVSITVADSGPGIPEAERVHIFTPFYTTKDNGTGMGLSVVQRIVESHGGRIVLTTEASKGATFTIHLPVWHGA